MVVGFIHEREGNISILKSSRCRQPAKAAADNYDVRLSLLSVVHLVAIQAQSPDVGSVHPITKFRACYSLTCLVTEGSEHFPTLHFGALELSLFILVTLLALGKFSFCFRLTKGGLHES